MKESSPVPDSSTWTPRRYERIAGMKRTLPALALAAGLALTGCTVSSNTSFGFVEQSNASAAPSANWILGSPDGRAFAGEGSDQLADRRGGRWGSDGTAYEWDGELINFRAEWDAFLAALPSRDALDVLERISIVEKDPYNDYSRELFGERWVDVDGNGCSTRNDILGRDLDNVKFKSKDDTCKVRSGDFHDAYSDADIHFDANDSKAVQIDHIVALSNAWRTGAQDLAETDRIALANDPYNLVASDGDANYDKSNADASEWLPADDDFVCEYIARQIGVKARYGLWVTDKEDAALQDLLEGKCAGTELPAYDESR